MILIFGSLTYIEFNNCIMYISSTEVALNSVCVILCLIPMMITAMVECQLFAYFYLLKERYKIINQSINFHKNNLKPNLMRNENIDEERAKRLKQLRSKIFFITEFAGSREINRRVTVKTDNGSKSNFNEILKAAWYFVKNVLNFRKTGMFADNFDAPFRHSNAPQNVLDPIHCVTHIMTMQIIYNKLHEISDLISRAYGIQIIAIISAQFITLTTLLYHFAMKIVRWE